MKYLFLLLLLPLQSKGQYLIAKNKSFFFAGYVFPLDALKIDTLQGKIKFSSINQIDQVNWIPCTSIKRQGGVAFSSCSAIIAFSDSFCFSSTSTPPCILDKSLICPDSRSSNLTVLSSQVGVVYQVYDATLRGFLTSTYTGTGSDLNLDTSECYEGCASPGDDLYVVASKTGCSNFNLTQHCTFE